MGTLVGPGWWCGRVSGQGCIPGSPGVSYPFCNTSLPIEDRVNNLLSQLSLAEKLGLIGGDTTYNTCASRARSVLAAGLSRGGFHLSTSSCRGGRVS